MNYAHFAEYIRGMSDDLVERFGVSREEADRIAQYVEAAGVADEAATRREMQMGMDFKRCGSHAMSKRWGITQRAARKRFNQIIKRPLKEPSVPV